MCMALNGKDITKIKERLLSGYDKDVIPTDNSKKLFTLYGIFIYLLGIFPEIFLCNLFREPNNQCNSQILVTNNENFGGQI